MPMMMRADDRVSIIGLIRVVVNWLPVDDTYSTEGKVDAGK